ncbi:MAG: hypothetical protein K2R93_21980, partial [Gemmatimonadaceae bacterium]|nr:hypothetical protein [Gemmatimonadaceae bacterium]
TLGLTPHILSHFQLPGRVAFSVAIDNIDQMLVSLRRSADFSAFRRTIFHIIQSRRRLPVHHALIHAFTALETLVGGFPSELERLDASDINVLQQRLRHEVKRFAKERGMNASLRAQLYGKLSELRRSPFVTRVVDACESLSVDPMFLWQYARIGREATLSELIRDAYARRSTLIHSGYVEDIGTATGDLLRIRALTELLLFFKLGGQPKWLRPLAWGDASLYGRWYNARSEEEAGAEDRAPWDAIE